MCERIASYGLHERKIENGVGNGNSNRSHWTPVDGGELSLCPRVWCPVFQRQPASEPPERLLKFLESKICQSFTES